MDLYIASIGFVDNRNFPGTDKRPPGPLGCELAPNSKAVGVVFSVMFRLNQWLADGLLVSCGSSSLVSVANPFRSSSCTVVISSII